MYDTEKSGETFIKILFDCQGSCLVKNLQKITSKAVTNSNDHKSVSK